MILPSAGSYGGAEFAIVDTIQVAGKPSRFATRGIARAGSGSG